MKTIAKKIIRVVVKTLYCPKLISTIQSIKEYIIFCTYESRFRKIGDNCRIGKNFVFHDEDCIEIGDNFYAGDYLVLEAWKEYHGIKYSPRLKIGNNAVFTNYIQISCINEVIIGNNVLLGHAVYISDNNHGKCNSDALKTPAVERELYSKGPVKIGDNVWIGRHVCVMPGVTIGDNCIIGANSVVTKDIPRNCVVAGSPAKIIRNIDIESDVCWREK